MARIGRELLRPEDATSWEEFQARCTVEQVYAARQHRLLEEHRAIGTVGLAGS